MREICCQSFRALVHDAHFLPNSFPHENPLLRMMAPRNSNMKTARVLCLFLAGSLGLASCSSPPGPPAGPESEHQQYNQTTEKFEPVQTPTVSPELLR